jgi:hypothetical protein
MARQPKTVSNASVRLLADHFLGGIIRKKGTILKGYSGPLSSNMKLIEKPKAEPQEQQGQEQGPQQQE